MIILELSKLNSVLSFSPVAPYVYQSMPGAFQLASFWTSTFGAADESSDTIIFVNSFVRAFTGRYDSVVDLATCLITEASFFWDNENQILYNHFEHDQQGYTDVYQYGDAIGLSDSDVVYIDDLEYLPLITGVPSIAQQQDLVNYDQLAFINGSASMRNLEGILDFFITANIFGNDAFLYYLDEENITFPGNATRDDLLRLAAFYIDNRGFSLTEFTVDLQDIRKNSNADVLDTFSITDYPDIGDIAGDVIPIMHGQVREAKAIPTNGDTTSGTVDFRVAILLTVIGTVQVDIDGIWTTKTPDSISLTTGEFVLSEANGRDASGAIRDCRLLLPTGIEITYTSDMIIDLNQRVIGASFNNSNYDVTEWQQEETSLSSGGWVFDEQIKLFDAIKLVQNGSVIGFRYEIKPDGRRTIRIDNPNRNRIGRVESVDFQNRSELPVATDAELVFAEIRIEYSKSFNSGKFLSVDNNDFSEIVKENNKQQNRNTSETMLNNETDANTRALNDATRFSVVPEILSGDLMGKEFLDLRIFDMLDIEITPGFADADNDTIVGREYYGFKKCKVIAIDPDSKNIVNNVKFQLIGAPDLALVSDDELVFVTDDGLQLVVPAGE